VTLGDPLKRLVSHLPLSWQQELRRLHYRRQILRREFAATDPEFDILNQLVSPGDWVIDVGANVGHYTKRMSDLVGPLGRVIAVEPVPSTFSLLAANVLLFQHSNVTLLNLAASDRTTAVGMRIPNLESGLKNYYEAALTNQEAELQVMTLDLDSLVLTQPVKLIKIDAEDHDEMVLRGMPRLLARDHPTLIVEYDKGGVGDLLTTFGYVREHLPGSPNVLFRWQPNGTDHASHA